MNKSFQTKQQYLAFRAAFAALANKRSIDSTDLILLNALRDKPLSYGFVPITNPTKLGCNYQNDGEYPQRLRLTYLQSLIKGIAKSMTYSKTWQQRINAQFNGTITPEAWDAIIARFDGALDMPLAIPQPVRVRRAYVKPEALAA